MTKPGIEAGVTTVRPRNEGHGVTSLFATRHIVLAICLTASYLLLSAVLVGFKGDQLFLVLLWNFLYFASGATRRFITGFSIFVVYWILFDWMKAFPNYRFNEVHIQTLYEAEKTLFGVPSAQGMLTPNEYFAIHHSTALDLAGGFFYLCWVPVPLLFAGIQFFRDRRGFFHFSLSFLIVNLIGFIIYYLYPAAPPWYVAEHGFNFIANTAGNTAGLARVDNLLGAGVFKSIYAKSSNVFAAMPSLHAAYMLIVLYYGIRSRMGWYNVIFFIIMLGIWFTGIYSSHHYVLDVLAGIACAIMGIATCQLFLRTAPGSRFLSRLITLTASRSKASKDKRQH